MNRSLRWVLVLLTAVIIPPLTLFVASAGTVVARPAIVDQEATHWGILPIGVIPTRDYEFHVLRFIDGKKIKICVSYRCYHSHENGDYYLGQY